MKLQFSAKFLQQKHQNSSGVLASIFSTKIQTKASIFSTRTPIKTQKKTCSSRLLYDRFKVISDSEPSIVPVLEQWVSEGRSIHRGQLQKLVGIMNNLGRFTHALQISQWLTDRHKFELCHSEIARRLALVHRVHGIELAEEYFNDVPKKAKTYKVYGALLNAYVQQKSVEKAEAVVQKVREMGMATSSFPYNMLITLYSQIREYDKIEVLIREMEEKGIPKDKKIMKVLMSAYVAASDISMMETVLKWVEKDPNFVMDWKLYSIAASGYLKVGLVEKALPMLKKMEDMMHLKKKKLAFEYLLTHWAGTGMKEELCRVWNKYKPQGRQFASSYAHMVTCLAKLDDIEGAEKIFEEWESKCTAMCGNRVLECLLIAYCKEGLFEKAESAVNKALEGSKSPASLWNVLAVGYEKDNQMPRAVEMLKRAISVGKRGWSPSSQTLDACLDYLEGQGDIDGIVDMIRALKNLGPVTRDIYHTWLRNCVAARTSVTEVLDQMKMDDISANEETNKILQSSLQVENSNS